MVNKNIKRSLLILAIAGAIFVLNQNEVLAEADSLCIHFTGTKPGGFVRLSSGYSLSGKLPLILCNDLDKGKKYRLFIEGAGFEKKTGIFELPFAGNPRVKGISFGIFARNALLPGWGDYYSERHGAAIVNNVTVLAGLYKFISEEQKYHHLRNRLDVLYQRRSEAESFDLTDDIQKQIYYTTNEINIQNRIRRRYAAAVSIFYLGQLIDPFILDGSPKANVEAGGSIVRFDLKPTSRSKAAFISLLRPGKGQIYQGKKSRGALFSIVTSLSAMVALNYHDQYDRAEYRYEKIVDEFNSTDNYVYRERLKEESEVCWDDVEKYRLRRNVAYITLAATWSWNILDSLIFPGSDTGRKTSPLSFDVHDNMLEMTLRF